jgi:hypothetical protein
LGQHEVSGPRLPAQVRAAFFAVAANILLRPIPPAEQDQTTAGRSGTYMVIARLLPLFETHARAHAAALRTKLSALTPDTPERMRQPNHHGLTSGLVPEEAARDRMPDILARLDRAKTPDERDAVYADAATETSRRDQERADEFVSKIEDTDTRRQVRAYIDFERLREAVAAKDVPKTLRLARAGELSSEQKVWALTEAARLLSKDEPGRAAEILDEAVEEARRIDQGKPERVRALVAVATRLAEVDRGRMWDLLAEVVKSSNQATNSRARTHHCAPRCARSTAAACTPRRPTASTSPASSRPWRARTSTRPSSWRALSNPSTPRTAAMLAVARAVLSDKMRAASAPTPPRP